MGIVGVTRPDGVGPRFQTHVSDEGPDPVGPVALGRRKPDFGIEE